METLRNTSMMQPQLNQVNANCFFIVQYLWKHILIKRWTHQTILAKEGFFEYPKIKPFENNMYTT